ncbi:hypothetical protein HY994_00560 [Candidatus Micrarchaeota archaeon]|nr:hypothetical protein [Candidatus Micrarchaeota archaeon]
MKKRPFLKTQIPAFRAPKSKEVRSSLLLDRKSAQNGFKTVAIRHFQAAILYLEKHDVEAGILAAAVLPGFYLILLTAIGGFSHALRQTASLTGWMAILSIGLGLQVQLFFRLRRLHGQADSGGVAASGGTSAFSMAACCAHHVADVLPAFGLAAAASFLSYYQDSFLLLGVLSNIGGLWYMLSCYQDSHLKTDGFLDGVMAFPLKAWLPFYLVSAAALFLAFAGSLWVKSLR